MKLIILFEVDTIMHTVRLLKLILYFKGLYVQVVWWWPRRVEKGPILVHGLRPPSFARGECFGIKKSATPRRHETSDLGYRSLRDRGRRSLPTQLDFHRSLFVLRSLKILLEVLKGLRFYVSFVKLIRISRI
jgi:hypothetical protein